MNRGKYGRMTLLVVLATVLALVLQGCGGDGDNSVEQDLRDQVAMLEGQLSDSETAQAAAETAAADAMAAQAAAEAERDAANTAKGAAEQAATTAMAAQTAAEMAQADAEAAQATAMAAQIAAQTAQATAETDRDAAMAAQMAAMEAQATAEAAQVAAVAAQATAEAERDAAMAAEMAAMEAQETAEAAEMAAEQAAATAMAAQAAAEAERDTNAAALVAAEAAREAAKDAEAAAKVAQAQAEAAQATAEADSADAMAAEMAAEAARMAAVEAQMAADTKAADYKMMAEDAEAARMAAVEAQMAADTKAADYKMMAEDAEAARMAAVEAQMAADTKAADYKMMAEDAEAARMAAVEAQKMAEDNAKKYMDELAELRGDVDDTTETDRNAAAKALLAVLMNNNVEYTLPAGIEAGDAVSITGDDAETAANYNRTGLVGTMPMAAGADVDTADPPTTAASDERQRVANDVSNLMVEVSEDGMLMAEAEDNAAYSMSEMAPDMIEGWRGAMLTRGEDPVTDTVVVYSDIGNDGSATLLDRYTSTLPTLTMPRMWTVTVLDEDDDPVNEGLIPWSEVERPDTDTAFAGAGDDAMLTFQGSVHGIPGTFSCTTGATAPVSVCRAPARYSDGTVNTMAFVDTENNPDGASVGDADDMGAWTFVPDAGVSLYTDDADYLTFGWWLLKDAAGNPADFLAFSTATGLGVMRAAASSATPVTDDAFNDGATVHTDGEMIRGSATYSGGAAGKYAMASGTADTYEGGHFTANATLMVDFDADLDGDTTIRTTDGVSLSGMIDNFMTGDTARPDWMVNLSVDNDGVDGNPMTPTATLIRDPALIGADADNRRMLTSWSTGAAATGTGTWDAQWYGGVTINADGDGIDTVGLPAAVVGTFNANIGTAARLQGAFGAMQDE